MGKKLYKSNANKLSIKSDKKTVKIYKKYLRHKSDEKIHSLLLRSYEIIYEIDRSEIFF